MAKDVQQLDRVVIRFAGDSGDGMQLTGDRFTTETAAFGNDLSTLPNFPAEIRAPAGTLPGVSALPAALRRPRHHDAGRRARRAGRDEPGGAEGQPRRPRRAAPTSSSTPTSSPRATWPRSATTRNPLEDGSLEAYTVHAVALTSMTVEALKGFDLTKKEAERAKNMFALGLLSWLYNRPTEGTVALPRGQVRPQARRSCRPTSPRSRPAGTSARPPRTSRSPTRSSRPRMAAGQLPQHLRQPGAVLRPGRRLAAVRAAAVPRRLPDHPGLGHPARAVQAQAVRRAHLPGRGRDRRRRRGARRGLRRRARRHDDVRPGRRAQGRDDRPRRCRSSCR